MSLDIHWTVTVSVPQIDDLTQVIMEGVEKLMASIDSIVAEVVRLNDNQAAASAALTEQVTKIADEVAQWQGSGTPVSDEQLATLETALRAAADTAAKQVADIQANTAAITGIVPDAPPA